MSAYTYEDVSGSFPGLKNYRMDIPGSSVTAYVGVFDDNPGHWAYSLWENDNTVEAALVSDGHLDFPELGVTPDQVMRIAFLLDVEYAEV